MIVEAKPTGIRIIESGNMTDRISQHGITWNFSEPVSYGKYVNGDYWVVGPVVITNITRPAKNNGRDGSMINPLPHVTRQGYDERWGEYVSSLNVANSLPIRVFPGSSLISTISRNPEITDQRVRPTLQVASILTVVDSEPKGNLFRPPYAGSNKLNYSTDTLQSHLLLRLSLVAKTPSLTETEKMFEKPWIDHVTGWQGDDFHPLENMDNYGAGISRDACIGALRLLLQESFLNKKKLLLRYIQLGIDNYGLVINGAEWGDIGGSIGVGRKLPIIVAGILLDDQGLKRVASDFDTRKIFQEDGQTNNLTQAMREGTYHPDNCNAGSDYCHEGWYNSVPIGTPVWGERLRRWEKTSYNFIPGKVGYRRITHASTKGAALWVHLMDAETIWNWNPFLNWTDRAHSEGWYNKGWGSDFVDNMWNAYR